MWRRYSVASWKLCPSFLSLRKATAHTCRLFIWEGAPIRNGDRGVLRVQLGPWRIRWVFEHRDYIEGRQFRDVQLAGPFRRWEHTHLFTPEGPGICILEDRIDYDLPFGALGNLLGGRFVRRKLEKLFAYRHGVTAEAMSSLIRDGIAKTS